MLEVIGPDPRRKVPPYCCDGSCHGGYGWQWSRGGLRTNPFPERGRQGHLGPVEFGLAASKDVQVHPGDKGPQFNYLGVVEGGDWETINVAETQTHMAISFGLGKSPKVESGGNRNRGKDNTWVVVVVIVIVWRACSGSR